MRSGVIRVWLLLPALFLSLLAMAPAAHAAWWLEDTYPVAVDATPNPATPAVAITPQGDIVVAYVGPGTNGQGKVVWKTRLAGTNTFGNINFGGSSREIDRRPALVTGGDGRIWMAYYNGSNDQVELDRSQPGDPESFTHVTQFAGGDLSGEGPALAATTDGAAVTYTDGNDVELGTWNGVTATTDELYDGDTTEGAGQHPRVTMDGAGNVVALWTHDRGFGFNCRIETRRKPAASSLSNSQNIGITGSHEAPACDTNDADLALGPSGRVLASWWNEDIVSIQYALAPQLQDFGQTTIAALASGQLDSHVHGLLGASDAMLLTYLTDNASAVDLTQRFSAGGPATADQLDFGLGTNNSLSLTRTPSGVATAVWSNGNAGIWGARGTVGTGLGHVLAPGPPTSLGGNGGSVQVATNPASDAAAVWANPGDFSVTLAIFDATAPVISNMTVPAAGKPGKAVNMSAAATDAISPLTPQWTFGDGAEAGGFSPSHAYAKPGTYTVKLKATDGAGYGLPNVTTQQRSIKISSDQVQPAKVGPLMALLSKRFRMSRKGVVRLTLRCPAGTEGGCKGQVALEQGATTASTRAKGFFSAASGKTVSVKLKVRKKFRRKVIRKRKLRVTLRITSHDSRGRARTLVQTVKLRARKH